MLPLPGRPLLNTSRQEDEESRARKASDISFFGGLVMPDRTYKVIELIGTSTDSWEKAAATVVERVRPQPGAIPRALRLIKYVV
jgi:hypothetical protein